MFGRNPGPRHDGGHRLDALAFARRGTIGVADDFDESPDIRTQKRAWLACPERSISMTLCRSTNHQITRSASTASPIKFHDSVELTRFQVDGRRFVSIPNGPGIS